MFGTLLGPLPRPPLPREGSRDAVLDAILEVQIEADLAPVSDAGWPHLPGDPVASWRAAASRAGRAVKATLTGPVSEAERAPGTDPVPALRTTILALAEAGCPLIEIHEPAAIRIGTDPAAQARFRDAHERLLEGIDGVHCSLAITGGSADMAGVDTLLSAPYASLALDLIDGPDAWRLVRAAPVTLGIVCGVVSAAGGSDDTPEILLWAAAYAASGGRGFDRVGLATASSLAHLPWDAARAKVLALGRAVAIHGLPPADRAAALDQRTFDIRTAALGRPRGRTARG